MTVRTMRALDRWIGIPLCWFSGFLLRLFRSRPARTPHEWRTILVMKFFGLGSVLLSTPMMTALRASCPHGRIIYLTFHPQRELLERLPQPDLCLTIDTRSAGRFVRDALTALRTIRGERVDIVFDLEFFSKFSTLVASLSGAPLRCGFDLPVRWRRMNLTHAVRLDRSLHVTSVFVQQLRPFGIEVPHIPPVTPPLLSLADRIAMAEKLGLETNGVRIVCVNINAGQTSLERRWSTSGFANVVRELARQFPAIRFFFTGSSGERAYVEHFLEQHTDVREIGTNCAGMLSLGELGALFERSDLFITNDSGPMHLAASIGTPVLALFGPESARFYGPAGRTSMVLSKPIPCSPCLNIYAAKMFVCPYDALCMKLIAPEEVRRAASSMLAKSVTAFA